MTPINMYKSIVYNCVKFPVKVNVDRSTAHHRYNCITVHHITIHRNVDSASQNKNSVK